MHYYRYRIDNMPVMSDWGYAMFAADREAVAGYGSTLYTYDGHDAVSINDLRSAISEEWERCKKSGVWGVWAPEDGMEELDGRAVAEMFSPSDIVNSAEGWDNAIVQWLWEHVLEPRAVYAVTTPNGAVVFDEKMIKKEEEERSRTLTAS